MKVVRNVLYIGIKNKVSYDVLATNPRLLTTKTEAHLHGFGVPLIKNCIEQYKGKVDYGIKGDYFSVEMYL